jgi:hypothetical protein
MHFGLPVVSTNLGIVSTLHEQHGEFGPSIVDVNADSKAIANAIMQSKASTINLDAYTADAMVARWREYLK